MFSLDAISPARPDPLLAGWRRRVTQEAAASLLVLTNLESSAWTVDVVADCPDHAASGLELSPVASGWALEAHLDHGESPSEAIEAFEAYHRIAVRPYWDAIQTVLESAYVRLVRLAGERGVEEMLSSLHPSIEWRPPALQIRRDRAAPEEYHLQGRGLVVVLSFFSRPGAYALPADPGSAAPPVLFVPVTPELSGYAGIWPVASASGTNLGALLGKTRAAVLQAVGAYACTTSELAERCGISISSASQHATVLREAGLIRTDRRRSAVVHSLTSTGQSLLDGPHGSADSGRDETSSRRFSRR